MCCWSYANECWRDIPNILNFPSKSAKFTLWSNINVLLFPFQIQRSLIYTSRANQELSLVLNITHFSQLKRLNFPGVMTSIFRTSTMISSVICSREAQRSVQSDSTVRTEAEHRRNSIPPMKTAAKHLLAYLPRPQQESSCQPPNSLKVPLILLMCYVGL